MAEDDVTAMSDWLKIRKIAEDVVKILVKEGYTSMEALAMLMGEDITDINAGLTKRQKIPQGQHDVAMMEQFKQKQKVGSEPSDVQSKNDGPTQGWGQL